MNYLIAGIVAGGLILSMFIFVWRFESEFQEVLKRQGVSTNTTDFGMELPGDLLNLMSIAGFLKYYRVILMVTILTLSFGIAFYCGNSGQQASNENLSINEEQP